MCLENQVKSKTNMDKPDDKKHETHNVKVTYLPVNQAFIGESQMKQRIDTVHERGFSGSSRHSGAKRLSSDIKSCMNLCRSGLPLPW